MARRPKPWWWSQIGEWCVSIDGQRHRLGPDKEAAETKFHELMSKPRVTGDSLAAIVDLFLQWTEMHRAPLTFAWYKMHLLSFLEHVKKLMPAENCRPHHVETWVDKYDWATHTAAAP